MSNKIVYTILKCWLYFIVPFEASLLTLKLLNVLDIDWLWVTAPLWIQAIIVTFIILLLVLLMKLDIIEWEVDLSVNNKEKVTVIKTTEQVVEEYLNALADALGIKSYNHRWVYLVSFLLQGKVFALKEFSTDDFDLICDNKYIISEELKQKLYQKAIENIDIDCLEEIHDDEHIIMEEALEKAIKELNND